MLHRIPQNTSPRLDLRCPPAGRGAAGYLELVDLLIELGDVLDHGPMDPASLRGWEREVLRHVKPVEVDVLMMPADDDDIDPARLPDLRWKNLRRILMRRKGLDG